MLRNCAYSAVRSLRYFNLFLSLWIRNINFPSWLFIKVFSLSFISSWLFIINSSFLFFKSYWWFFRIINSRIFSWGSSLGLLLIEWSEFGWFGNNLTLSFSAIFSDSRFYGRSWIWLSEIFLLLIITWDSLFHVNWSFFFIHGLSVFGSSNWFVFIHNLIIEAVIELSSCGFSKSIFNIIIDYFLNVPSQ